MPGFINTECTFGGANCIDADRTHGGGYQQHWPALICAFDMASSRCDRGRMFTCHLSLAHRPMVSKAARRWFSYLWNSWRSMLDATLNAGVGRFSKTVTDNGGYRSGIAILPHASGERATGKRRWTTTISVSRPPVPTIPLVPERPSGQRRAE